MSSLVVLHVTQTTVGGVPHVVRAMIEDQLGRGMDVSVACPPMGQLWDGARALDATCIAWAASRSVGPSVVAETWRLSRIVKRCAPDVVHLHSSKAGLVGRLALRGHRPTVFQPHAWSFLATTGRLTGLTEHWERVATRWTDALAVVSVGERDIGEQAGVCGPWVMLPNGVDVRRRLPAGDAARAAARDALGLGAGPLVACVGRLTTQKGQDILLDAWPAVVAAVPAARLVLVGGGPDEVELARRRVAGVVIAGERRDVDCWLTAADVVALPSRFEAGSLVVLEAMALGRSVVATDVAGVRECLGGGAGAVVPVEDRQALADEIIARLLDPALAAREGSVARALVEREYDLDTACARTAELYERLVLSR